MGSVYVTTRDSVVICHYVVYLHS